MARRMYRTKDTREWQRRLYAVLIQSDTPMSYEAVAAKFPTVRFADIVSGLFHLQQRGYVDGPLPGGMWCTPHAQSKEPL